VDLATRKVWKPALRAISSATVPQNSSTALHLGTYPIGQGSWRSVITGRVVVSVAEVRIHLQGRKYDKNMCSQKNGNCSDGGKQSMPDETRMDQYKGRAA